MVTSPEVPPKLNDARFAPLSVTALVSLAVVGSPAPASAVMVLSYASREANTPPTEQDRASPTNQQRRTEFEGGCTGHNRMQIVLINLE
jgi:hypothetical protein